MAAAKGQAPVKAGARRGAGPVAVALAMQLASDPRIYRWIVDHLTDPELIDFIKRQWARFHDMKFPTPRPRASKLTAAEELAATLDAAEDSIAELAELSDYDLPLDTWRRRSQSLRLALPTLDVGSPRERRRRAKDLKRRAAALVTEIFDACIALPDKEQSQR